MFFIPFFFIILIIIFIFLLLSAVYVVRQQSVAIIERFGRYHKTSSSGINFRLPLGIDKIAARVQLRLLQSEIIVETKTQDTIFPSTIGSFLVGFQAILSHTTTG